MMAGYRTGMLLRTICILLLITQISAGFGRKTPSSGRGPGPGGGSTNPAAKSLTIPASSSGVKRPASSARAAPATSAPATPVVRQQSLKQPPEIFFLHVEEGYFGCQVNESTDVLQLYDVSKLCDGQPDCFRGSDEDRIKLKCTADCVLTQGAKCQNGACLDHECYCNDGYGGCGCSTTDENECKYRPCDVFAHCTNTLGSFFCTCFPGYEGNGFSCTDVDECKDPAVAARCGENAECCNLPATYECRCKAGFQGDANSKCSDIDECQNPSACGDKALCQNTPGNYTCSCPPGYAGNPYNGCADVDECELGNACGSNSLCRNTDGGYTCSCPAGFTGDPKVACIDVDECSLGRNDGSSVCGRSAICDNLAGSYRCQCPAGFKGDPNVACEDVNECLDNPCGANATCSDTPGSFSCSCKEDYTGDPYRGCVDIDECAVLTNPCGKSAICRNTDPGYECACPRGYVGKPNPKVACEQVDVASECVGNFDCINNAECKNKQCSCIAGFQAQGAVCEDIDECLTQPCGPRSVCSNLPGSYRCECEPGLVGKPPTTPCKAPCEGVKCGSHATCKTTGDEAFCICDDGWTYDPANITAGCQDIDECDLAQGLQSRCGEGAICSNTAGSFSCSCPPGFTGNPTARCSDIDECQRPDACGMNALCTNTIGSYSCSCPAGTTPMPDAKTKCVSISRCALDDDCPGNSVCENKKDCKCPVPNIGPDCRHPCDDIKCQSNQECMLTGTVAKCMCSTGFTAGPKGGCVDIDECSAGQKPCASGAVCRNEPGKFVCECPSGFEGDPYKSGCVQRATAPPGCTQKNPCPSGEVCVPTGSKQSVCACARGWVRDTTTGLCRDVNECLESPADRPACGFRAVCKNLPGSYDCSCPPNLQGNPFQSCDKCDSEECRCQPPYQIVAGACLLAGCAGGALKCPSGAECVSVTGGVSYCACPTGYRPKPDGSCEDVDECASSIEGGASPCGFGALCINRPGRFECRCPDNMAGEPYKGICAPSQVRCVADSECGTNQRCVQPGECVCPPPYYLDTEDGNKCKSPCERHACGVNAKCTPSDPPKCMCEPGHTGNPTLGCSDIDECRDNPCAPGAQCINENGGFKCRCPSGLLGDAYQDGCKGEARSECNVDKDCDAQLACVQGSCVNPCQSLPCGANAYCEPEEHAAWCRCSPGFKEDKKTGACISLCAGISCGENGQCVVSSAASAETTCACLDGFNGNPFPGGSCLPDVCSATVPCQEPQVCVSGRCKERCEGITCGVGAKCDKATNKCVCLPFFVGLPDLLCVPPVVPPICSPPCGKSAHCEYGQPNRCVCDSGYSGNPYESCGAQARTCDATKCGAHAECRDGPNRVDCVCPVGFQGNPYVGCEDINECVGAACGANAICINTPGSYDCRCQDGFAGNPFMMCMPGRTPAKPDTPFVTDPCSKVTCGPNSACRDGKCLCLPGFSGSPCAVPSCRNDLDCKTDEICLPVGGGRRCLDACSRDQCGPNAVCLANAHKANCICRDGFQGNPNDLSVGCRPGTGPEDKCGRDDDCPGTTVCGRNVDGIRACVDPCLSFTCGQGETCKVQNNKPFCECLASFVRNPSSGICEKPGLPDCVTNSDCRPDSTCRPDVLGVRKCTSVCTGYTCPPNSDCRASAHVGQCVCRAGFTGNANDRNGCRPVPKDQCQTDAQCPDNSKCQANPSTGVRSCSPACATVRCGPGAVCVANNHAAKCSCPTTGRYAPGDPATQGCRSAQCLANTDCPTTHTCDQTSYTCKPVCVQNSCGKNAICLAENHMAMCSCPAGYEANPHPEVECIRVDLCASQPCHATAFCTPQAGRAVCACPSDRIGDPYKTGCRANGTCPLGNSDCPSEAVCLDGRCSDPCDAGLCGPNAQCRTLNHSPVCSCQPGFNPNPTADRGCVRRPVSCRSEADCSGNPCLNGQCKAVCRNAADCAQGERCAGNMCQVACLGHEQCPVGQACVSGYCTAGCRVKTDCPINQDCLNHRCENPCQREGVCGPNAQCRVIDRTAQCACPPGFTGGPTAQQGCMRNPVYCQSNTPCPAGMTCQSGRCYPSCRDSGNCAGGERCLTGQCVKVCYTDNNCLSGEVCIDGGCRPGCRSDTDCSQSSQCVNSQCRCAQGYQAGPNGCIDIDECKVGRPPCHQSAQCVNTPGSFRCNCREGTVGDPYGEPGCVAPNQCKNNAGCPDQLACIARTPGGPKMCSDPCASTTCGRNAQCTAIDHQASCSCPDNTRGDPTDSKLGCFRVDCIENDDCPSDRSCDKLNYKCYNPCERMDCYNGVCQVKNRKAICQCAPGFRSTPDNKCVDVDECSSVTNPCHPTAQCRNTPGNFQCTCPAGLVGEPYKGGCKRPGSCATDSDCPLTASCIGGVCKDPCSIPGSCGTNSECTVENHAPLCRCAFQTTGDPKVGCNVLQCVDGSDCSTKETCVNNKCVDACAASKTCGPNSSCKSTNHRAVCECKAGFTGDAYQGCVNLIQCTSESQCPASMNCVAGSCVSRCTSSRDCLPSQQCIEGKCRPACSDNSQCPRGMACSNSVCIQEVRCRTDQECGDGERCFKADNGKAECGNPCQGAILCGRNAECAVVNRQAVCTCKTGFFGNPQDDKIGCIRIECSKDSECSADKRCHENRCKIACMVDNACGKNTLCFSERHTSVCKCQPGFTGDTKTGCTPIDYCSQTPCAAGARCDNTRGSYKCTCPAGTVGEPYKEGCQNPVECRADADCPPSTVCGQERGKPKCVNVCAGFNCGGNADCSAVNRKATCACRQGYEGNPVTGCTRRPVTCRSQTDCPANTYCYNSICKPACQSDSECLDTETCFRGQCADPCTVGKCGLNAICRSENHQRVCSCTAGFTGTASTECIRIPTACQRDGECESGLRCQEGRCIPGCSSDTQCALNEKCVNKLCMLTCSVDNDCFLSHICLKGMCNIGCRRNEDCSTDEACINSRCKDPCSGPAVCGPNALCNSVNQRAQCTCPTGFLAYPTPNVACVREPSPCTGTKSCAPGFVCQSSVCRPLCTADTQCLVNERCSQGMCVPVCRLDTDCTSGEICSMGMCKPGCRADSDCQSTQSCLNNQCVGVCDSPAACGTNAKCKGVDHRPQCTCLEGLVGNAKVACRYPPSTCTAATECLSNQKCIGGMCRPGCANDQGCLSDSRCIDGTCSPICNSDAYCDRGSICIDRVCKVGCRNDDNCPANQGCINNKCSDPCRVPNVCGNCAVCEVINHAAQCSCPAGSLGNPKVGCSLTPTRCGSSTDCLTAGGGQCTAGFCSKACTKSADCSCGATCQQGRCRFKCSTDNQCPTGQLCRTGICAAGCTANSDCSVDQACVNGQCANPCATAGTCGKSAECRVSDHLPVCLCPSGFGGNPSVQCQKNECEADKDCGADKSCQNGRCIIPCLEPNVCGKNAMCRVVTHRASCLCPPGFYGNAQTECKQDVNECLTFPCGANALCTDTVGSFTCTCQPGCVGDPKKGCICTAPSIDPCADSGCGTNANCRVEGNQPVCYCPPSYPSGNPRVKCTVEPRSPDCQTEGCGKGATCALEGSVYSCRCLPGLRGDPNVLCSTDQTCSFDTDCATDKSCINKQCQDPCSLRDACGMNALCQVVIHKARCSCPQCYIGRASVKCSPDPKCATATTQRPPIGGVTTPSPSTERPTAVCLRDTQCTTNHACNTQVGACADPCEFKNIQCDQGKRCEVRRHRPVCVCKHGFVISETGEMSCGPNPIECRVDDECASNTACISGRCVSPCAGSRNPCASSPGKSCQVLDHKAVCVCLDDCQASVSICLRDRGCPVNMACVNYQCKNPCENFSCPDNRPCYVEDHKAVCKFCPPGFVVSPQYGCVQAIGCRADSDCPARQSCINGRCDEPIGPKEPVPVVGECPPCKAHEECDQATLTCFPGPISVLTEKPLKPSEEPSIIVPGIVPISPGYPSVAPPVPGFTYPPSSPVGVVTQPTPTRPGYAPATTPQVPFTYPPKPPTDPVVEEVTTPPTVPSIPPGVDITVPLIPVVTKPTTPGTPPVVGVEIETTTSRPGTPSITPTYPTLTEIPPIAETPEGELTPVTGRPSIPPTDPVVVGVETTPPVTGKPPTIPSYPSPPGFPPVAVTTEPGSSPITERPSSPPIEPVIVGVDGTTAPPFVTPAPPQTITNVPPIPPVAITSGPGLPPVTERPSPPPIEPVIVGADETPAPPVVTPAPPQAVTNPPALPPIAVTSGPGLPPVTERPSSPPIEPVIVGADETPAPAVVTPAPPLAVTNPPALPPIAETPSPPVPTQQVPSLPSPPSVPVVTESPRPPPTATPSPPAPSGPPTSAVEAETPKPSYPSPIAETPSPPVRPPADAVITETEPSTPRPAVTYPSVSNPPAIPAEAETPPKPPAPVPQPPSPSNPPSVPVVAETPKPPQPPDIPYPPAPPTIAPPPPVTATPSPAPSPVTSIRPPQTPVPVVAEPAPTPSFPDTTPRPPAIVTPPTLPSVAETSRPSYPSPTKPPAVSTPAPAVPVVAETPSPSTSRPVVSPPPVSGPPSLEPIAETSPAYPPPPTQLPPSISNPPGVPAVAQTPSPPTPKPDIPYPSYPGPSTSPPDSVTPSPYPPPVTSSKPYPPPTEPVIAEPGTTPDYPAPTSKPPYIPTPPPLSPVAETSRPDYPSPTKPPSYPSPAPAVPVVGESPSPSTSRPITLPPAVSGPPSLDPIAETTPGYPPGPATLSPSISNPPTVPVIAETPPPPTTVPGIPYPPSPSVPPYPPQSVTPSPSPPAGTTSRPVPPTEPVIAEPGVTPDYPTVTSRPPLISPPPVIPPVAETSRPEYPSPTRPPSVPSPSPGVPVVAETPSPSTSRPITRPPAVSGPPSLEPIAETPPAPPGPTQQTPSVSNPPSVPVVAESPSPSTSRPTTRPPVVTGPPSLEPIAETSPAPPGPTQQPPSVPSPPTAPVEIETTRPPVTQPPYVPVPPTGPPYGPPIAEVESPTTQTPTTPSVRPSPPTSPVVAEYPPSTPEPVRPPPPNIQTPPSLAPIAEIGTPSPQSPIQGTPSISSPPIEPVIVGETPDSPSPKPPSIPSYPSVPTPAPVAELPSQRPPPVAGPSPSPPPISPIVEEKPDPYPYPKPTPPPYVPPARPPPPTAAVAGQVSTPAPESPLPPLTERPIPGTSTRRPLPTRPVTRPTRPPSFELPGTPPRPIGQPGTPAVRPPPILDIIPPKTGCTSNSDCADSEACDIPNERCVDPCSYQPCAPTNSQCQVAYHQAVCACRPGFTGIPTVQCQPVVVGECKVNDDCPYDRYCDQPTYQCFPVCTTRVCGKLASCQAVNHNAVCTCLEGFTGNPKDQCSPAVGCRSNADCPSKEACVNSQCVDPCRCAPGSVCEVRNHNAVCKCPAGTTGDPTTGCRAPVVAEPCNPSPCGPNSDCRVGPTRNPICTCRPGFYGDPQSNRGCGPECTTNSECPSDKACINQKCADPCPGACGIDAKCQVTGHNPACACLPGYQGNAYDRCTPIPVSPVVTPTQPPPKPYPQQPPVTPEERPECVLNSDCPSEKACVNRACIDPCPGVCGPNAICKVSSNNPICSCVSGYIGDPTRSCYPRPAEPVVVPPAPLNPCNPPPCGSYSECRVTNNQAVCSCLPGYYGNPCRPECVASSDCPSDRACINQKCQDPCPGSCGVDAQCEIKDHNPICFCVKGSTGDPFVRCERIPVQPETVPPQPKDPCDPHPCGPGAQCKAQGTRASCTCPPSYIGDPYKSCRPECVTNTECPRDKSCANNRCVDPCPGVCGLNAECRVINHNPVCSCITGYTGDASSACRPTPVESRPIEPVISERPCTPSPCGPNSVCREVGNVPACSCEPGYQGLPPDCRPECSSNSECGQSKACINQKCRDPCAGVCGEKANCVVINHNPICSCPKELTGDPFVRCGPFPARPELPVIKEPVNPCIPTPCGPNSQCQVVGGQAKCDCLANMIGRAPNCRPECVVNSDCSSDRACISQRCKDPCDGTCGAYTQCRVIGHNPVCSCVSGYSGDPFRNCVPIQPAVVEPAPRPTPDPCVPFPCGANAKCRDQNGAAICQCLPEYFGDARQGCKPECVLNSDCASTQSCVNNKCIDPCPGLCGLNAECRVVNHLPTCLCQPSYLGDPYSACRPAPVIGETPAVPPPKSGCNPSPCGVNAECRDVSGKPECKCPLNYRGDPFVSCRPECVINTDCPRDQSCARNRCQDPCTDACGSNAECRVANHVPVCVCRDGYEGNPFSSCAPIPVKGEPSRPIDREDVCIQNPCGTNAECRPSDGVTRRTCVCLPGLLGDPYVSCKPECTTNSDCPNNQACFNQLCRDPCVGACGLESRCQVIGHNPVCSCPNGYTGDPFVRCQPRPAGIEPVVKPECEVDRDCQTTQACIEQRCINPCIERAAICARDAVCRVVQHRPICVCAEGFIGDPQVQCRAAGCSADTECGTDEACINRQCKSPCAFEACGTNADCKVTLHRAQCVCPDRFIGDPYKGCRQPECQIDEDCPSELACREKNCRDPCNCPPGTRCTVINHVPRCICPPGFLGEPDTPRGCYLPEEPAVGKAGCASDGECPSKHACFNGECIQPCTTITPCGINAQCLVIDSLPLRTMTCQCLPGYFGNPNVECKLVPVEPAGCRSNSECPDRESCRNGVCINPCTIANPCATNAVCTVSGHAPKCACPEDYTGNPNINCYQIPKTTPECRSDTDCPLDKACNQQVCQDPCVEPPQHPCGGNARCKTQQHRPVCYCPDGWGGDPQDRCFRPECERDEDCPSDRACISGKCLNPCVVGGNQCGTNSLCRVTIHRPQCYCPTGTQGNPTAACIPVGCQSHDDCDSTEVCDRLNRICVKVCETVTCAPTAICTGKMHQAICNCPTGQRGNPFVRCIPDFEIATVSPPRPECRSDPECPSKNVCINERCVDPCGVQPCGKDQLCSVVDSTPLRTVVCQCPSDSFLDENSRCRSAVTGQIPPQLAGCKMDDECPADQACRNGVCESPCDCHPTSICKVINRKPVCACPDGMTGDPLKACFKIGCRVDEECPGDHACVNGDCKPVCHPTTCVSGAVCKGVLHRAICECPPGMTGNPDNGCLAVGCTNTNDCNPERACINGFCQNPCSMPDACQPDQECKPFNHTAVCECPPGFKGSPDTACTRADVNIGCSADTDCPSLEACINGQCKEPCSTLVPCAPTAICEVRPTVPSRTMICVCPPGTRGYAGEECVKIAVPILPEEQCVLQRGQIRLADGSCVCDPERGLVRSPNGTCICDTTKGLVESTASPSPDVIICVVPPLRPDCVSNDDCPDDKYCNSTCRNPCSDIVCFPNSECKAANHQAICACIRGTTFKDDVSGCIPAPPPFRTDAPTPDIVVNCLADGVQVDMRVEQPGFDGTLYVKSHSRDANCRRAISAGKDVGTVDFKVRFDTCGLVMENGQANFILVLQRHPKLMTFKAQAYQLRCLYDTPEKTVTVGFNVSMLTTAGTISNTGPPPVCTMKIVLPSGQEVRQATIGDTLQLKVEVSPTGIYGGFARSCYAVTDSNNTHLVTDENGCATDPTIFGEWVVEPETQILVSNFNAFKFPASDNIRFQCNIRVCFGRCQPVNCRGQDAFGRRRRRQAIDDAAEPLPTVVPPGARNATAVEIRESVIAGQLREEITVQSNSILALDRGAEERFSAPTEAPDVVREEVCVSTMGFIIALIITALLALVAVAVAVSCWLMAYRRRPKVEGPLPHPAEFPNPLFTTPEPLTEPSPDYLS